MSANGSCANTQKPKLVLLHGWGMNSYVWQTIYPRLAPHFQLQAIDLPGYGLRCTDETKTLAETAACIAAQFSGPAALLGWSLGGLIAMQLACDFSQKVTHLINIASSPCFLEQPDWKGLEPEVFDRFQQQLLHNPKRTLERFIGLQTLGTKSGFEDSRVLRRLLEVQPLPSTPVLQRGLMLLRQGDLRESLMQITAPVLTIYGELDHIVPYQPIQQIVFSHPHSKTYRLAMAGHVPFLSHPDEVARLVVKFLKNG